MIPDFALYAAGGAIALFAAADLVFGLSDGSGVFAKGFQRLSGKQPETDMDGASSWVAVALLALFVGVIAIGAVRFWLA